MSENQVRFWLTRFRKLDPNMKSHRETLINTFVNAVYLYDEKVLITFNYKDGTKTITFDEIAAKDAPEGNGSDLGCFAPPRKRLCRNTQAFFSCDPAAAIDAGGFEPKNRGTPHAGHASVFLMFLFCYLTLPCAPAAAGTNRTRCSARRPPEWKWGPPGRSWSGWRSAGCS